MKHATVFLTLRSRQRWELIINREKSYIIQVEDSNIKIQIPYVLHHIQEILIRDFKTKHAVIWTPRWIAGDLEYTFPYFKIITIDHPGIRSMFHEIFRKEAYSDINMRKNKNDTLYICSDASVSVEQGLASWAWASSGGTYGYGLAKNSSSSSAELEGICQAIIENKNTDFKNIHVYCDNLAETERITDLLTNRTPEIFITDFQNGTEKIAQKVLEISKYKNITVSWVRGHKGHRLNEAADFISKNIRTEISSGKKNVQREQIFESLKYFTN